MGSRAIVIYCGLLMTASAVAIDVILPAFARMSTDLDASYASIQLVVPVFIFAAGIGQLFWGAISDRFGRKPILQIGLAGFVVGSILCLFANNIELMLSGRVIQGFFVASGSVISRAVLRDLFSGKALARNMAFATMIFAFGPIVGPIIGAGVMEFTTWRYILLIILIFGAALLSFAFLGFEETIANKKRSATNLSQMWKNLRVIFENSQSKFFIIMSGSIGAVIIFILISLPRVFWEEYKIDGSIFALLFAIHGLGIIIGQFLNRRLITLYGVRLALLVGATILTISAMFIVFMNIIEAMNSGFLIAALTLLATSHLVVVSNATSLTLDPHGEIAGFVASIYGFISQTVAAIIGIILAMIVGGNVVFFGYGLLGLTAFNSLALISRVKSPD